MSSLARRLNLFLQLAILVPALVDAQPREGVDILLGKARSLEARGRMDLAAQNWNQVLLVNPNQTEALAGLARQAKQNGDANSVRVYLDRLRKINPRDPAIAAIDMMRVLTPRDRARLDEAGRLAGAKKYAEAMRIYRDVFGDDPPWGQWAEAFYATMAETPGGREEAIARLRQITSRDPGNEVHRLWLARILSYEPKTRMESLRLLESIRDAGTVEQARTVWREGLIWEKDNPSVQASLAAYLQRYPDQELQAALTRLRDNRERQAQGAEKQRGFQALENKDVSTAQQRFEDVLHRAPNDASAIAGLGFVRLEQKRFMEAVALFDKARALAPERTDIREGYETAAYWSAVERGANLQTRDSEAAIAAYQAALAIRPGEDQPALGIAQVMLRRKNFSEAAARFEQVLRRSPDNAEATIGLGFVRLNEKNFAEAETLLAKGRALAPGQADVEEGYRSARFWGLMTKASAAFTANQLDVAITSFQEALTLDPKSKDASLGLAGSAERSRDYTVAINAYERVTVVDPNDEGGWFGLIRMQINAGNPSAALQTSQRVPTSVRSHLEAGPAYLAVLSLALFATERYPAGTEMLRRALSAAASSDTEEALAVRLHVAAMLIKQGNVDLAVSVYKHATERHPNNVHAWQGLVGAYASLRDFTRAMATVRAMPRSVYGAATKDAGFLNAVAAAYAADGRCDDAEGLLTQSLNLDRAAGRNLSPNTELQLADIFMRTARYDRATQAFGIVISADENSIDAWRGYITAFHKKGDNRTALAESRRIPAATRAALGKEADFLTLLASVSTATNQTDQALTLLEEAKVLYQSEGRLPPTGLELQLGWAMLASSRPDSIGNLVTEVRARSDLTPNQRAAVDELWWTWTIRRAEAASKNGDGKSAVAILIEAWQQMPQSPLIPSALAATYVRRGEHQQALDVYRTWGMVGATASDYRTAAGAALALDNTPLANRLLQEGVQRWPDDRELLRMTGKQAASRGSYREAERLLEAALLARDDRPAAQRRTADPGLDPAPATSAPACRQDVARAEPAAPRIRLASASRVVLPQTPRENSPTEPQDSEQVEEPQDSEQAEEIQDEIDSLRYRNSPFASAAFSLSGRSGDPGIARLIIRDGAPGGSFAINNMVRLGIDVHSVTLSNGTPDGRSESRFGTLMPGAIFIGGTASGYSGEIQLSGDAFGLSFGTSPRGFLTDTWIGGLRLGRPDGPIRLMAVRDRVKDSMLSYAAVRDPGTGTVWGGVVSNSVSVQLSHRNSGTGQYVVLGGGILRGDNVLDNWNAEGSAGAYWTIAPSDQARLTLGLNLAAMHYDNNQNFFSFGHGGYFSPQKFAQASVPLSLSARLGRSMYEFTASPGFQYFTESSAPFYPTRAIAIPGEPFAPLSYDAQEHQGAAYNVVFRAHYRIAPHWHLGAYAATNNTRDYKSRSAGLTLKLLARPLPTTTDLLVKSIPDWRGNQPFGY